MQQAYGRFWMALGALAALAVVLALGMGSGTAQAQGGAAVSIVDFAFQPGSVEVPVGGSVTWTNNGSATHTVTSDSGAFDSGQLAPGATFSQTFDTAGTFTYHCSIHPQMTGTVIVTSGGGGGAEATAPAAAGNQGNQATNTTNTQPNRVPRTGVGTMAAGHTGEMALLAAAAAVLLGAGAVVAARRA
jgi:plastocyanin